MESRLIPAIKAQVLREVIEHLEQQCEWSEEDTTKEPDWIEQEARALFLNSRLTGLEIGEGRMVLHFPEGTMVLSREHGLHIESADGSQSLSSVF
jgi:hypothetical protein